MSRRKGRGAVLAFRAAAILAVGAAVATGALMALSNAPVHDRRAMRPTRVHRQVIAAADAGGDAEPVAEVIAPDDVPEAAVWPPALLNPEGRLRLAWDLTLGRPNSHEILFTFDDGPNPGTTDRLLRILDRAGIHAAFFVCGWRMEAEEPLRTRARQILRDTLAAGHIVGNHTVHHRVLPQLTPEQVRYEIDHNADLIEEVIGQRPHLFRPPYGSYSEEVRRNLVRHGNELWLWSIDSRDWATVNNAEGVAERVILNIANHAGGTVLLHDTHPWSVAAVPKILRWIEETNRERVAQGREPYTIVDPARYLEGARARLPMLLAQQGQESGRTGRAPNADSAVPADAAVEPTTGPVAEDPAVAAPVDAAAPPHD